MGSDPVIDAIIAVSALLLAAKLLAELCARFHIPVVLGELTAGIILGPVYFAGLLPAGVLADFFQVNEVVLAFGEIGAIVILFVAGLQMPFREFIRGGVQSFTTGGMGVIVPFFGGLLLFTLLGFPASASLMVAAAMTATSIAISVETLREIGQLKTPEGKLIIGAAVVDDVLAIAILSVVVSITGGGGSLDIFHILYVIASVLFLFGALLVISELLVPRLVQSRLWKTPGSLEAVITASFFGMAAVAGSIGLSPIVGAFVAGMALANANIMQRMTDYIEKLEFIFRPLFFAVIGSQVNLGGINSGVAVAGAALIAVAVVTKVVGCGLPAAYFLRSRDSGRLVGTAMISRGEVGLIVAGVAVASGAVSSGIYSVIVLMVVATTIITPILLRRVATRPVSIVGLPVAEPKVLDGNVKDEGVSTL